MLQLISTMANGLSVFGSYFAHCTVNSYRIQIHNTHITSYELRVTSTHYSVFLIFHSYNLTSYSTVLTTLNNIVSILFRSIADDPGTDDRRPTMLSIVRCPLSRLSFVLFVVCCVCCPVVRLSFLQGTVLILVLVFET